MLRCLRCCLLSRFISRKMEVDSKTLRFQTSLGSESGEELCHFLSGTWSILVPMARWLLKPSSGVEGPSQIQKASGDYRECGRQPTFSTPQRRLCKPDGRKLRDRRVSHSWDKRTHRKTVVWSMPGTPRELRHLVGARMERCCTQNQQYTHLGTDVASQPQLPRCSISPPPQAKLRWKPTEKERHGAGRKEIFRISWI